MRVIENTNKAAYDRTGMIFIVMNLADKWS